MPIKKPIIERLLSHISPEPNSGCWLWIASLDTKGYGQINIGTGGKPKMARSHREMYLSMIGPIPEGLELDHLCRVRCCVNPAHLEPVTHEENYRRGLGGRNGGIAMGKIKRARTHCPRGHSFADGNEMFQNGRGKRWRYCRSCKELSRSGLLYAT